ncbi:thiamine phosphate synthase [Pelagibaculum spongiae]|uniref:thiamine phosphate synthase n=1 Tax=Pelagibaculum spongiae TaxID=2080658 RepID=UPI0019D44E15|nr:thiamine phosphate synthase [Pelagibaculum spongiae]
MTHDQKLACLRGLYVITDEQLTAGDSLAKKLEAALEGGAKVVQYRDKSHGFDYRLAQALRAQTLCFAYDALFLINDDIELASYMLADGVHLGQSDISLTEAREKLGERAIIGISCEGSIELAEKAVEQGADYIAFGAIYPSKTKPDAATISVDVVQQAKQKFTLPVCAIGGIELSNAQPLLNTGCDMLAVVNSVFGQDDIQQAATSFSQMFEEN